MRIVIVSPRILSCLPCCRGIRIYYLVQTKLTPWSLLSLQEPKRLQYLPGSLFPQGVDLLQCRWVLTQRGQDHLSPQCFQFCLFEVFLQHKDSAPIPFLRVYKFVVTPSNIAFLALLFTWCQSNIRSCCTTFFFFAFFSPPILKPL